MGFMKNISNLFKPDDTYEDENEFGEEEYEEEAPVKESRPASASRPAGVSSNASLEMKIIKPEKYEDVTSIAQHLLHRRTVVLNLENTTKENVRRIIDFLSGVAFAIGGNLNRVANSTYVITPKNVDLSEEQKETSAAEEKTTASSPRDYF